MNDEEKKPQYRVCRYCKGSGIDPNLPQRYTSGGYNDRSCEKCDGEGVIYYDEDEEKWPSGVR